MLVQGFNRIGDARPHTQNQRLVNRHNALVFPGRSVGNPGNRAQTSQTAIHHLRRHHDHLWVGGDQRFRAVAFILRMGGDILCACEGHNGIGNAAFSGDLWRAAASGENEHGFDRRVFRCHVVLNAIQTLTYAIDQRLTLFGNAQGLSQFPNVGVHLFDGGRYARQRHDVNFLRPQLIQHDLKK